jgi:hypothetical protein
MSHLYAIQLRWRHEGKRVEACALLQAASASSALEKLKQLLPTRVPDDSVEIISDASKVQDNCFIVSGKEPAFPNQITLLGASF